MRDAGFGAGVAQVFSVLGQGLLLSGRHDHRDAHEDLDCHWVATRSPGSGAHLVHLGAG